MELTINIVWVTIAAITLIFALIGAIIKSSREAEKFESWLKTHEKEIDELKKINHELNNETKMIREAMNSQALDFGKETREIEQSIAKLYSSLTSIDLKLEYLIEGKITQKTKIENEKHRKHT